MQFFSQSDCGKVRTNNEDNCYLSEEAFGLLMIVADGMGGHQAGEIASYRATRVAAEYIKINFPEKTAPYKILGVLRTAVKKANEEVFLASVSDNNLKGMGTTIDICVITGTHVYIAHVGDSRVYRISKEGEITQITSDHSLVQYLLENGTITQEEAQTHPQRNIITRALGTENSVETDTYISEFKDGDNILLCSDGLTNMVSDTAIAEIVLSESSPEKAVTALINAANDAGGSDNITAVLARNE